MTVTMDADEVVITDIVTTAATTGIADATGVTDPHP